MTILVFPHAPWRDFSYRELLRPLGEQHSLHYVTDGEKERERLPGWIAPLAHEQCAAMSVRPKLAVVTHPYWIAEAAGLRPERLVVLLPERTLEENTPVWNKCLHAAAGAADLLAVASEAKYLEYAFKKRAVWLLRDFGINTGSDAGESSVQHLLSGAMLGLGQAEAIAAQQQALASSYAELRERTGPHETVSFLLSAYEYLLGLPEAESHLLEAFLQAAQLGRADCLTTHYRFVSAILAARDELPEAVAAYGITALSPGDKRRYETLCELLELGKPLLAKASLLCCNDDFAGALAVLDGEFSPEAGRLRFRTLLDRGDREAALDCMPSAANLADKRDALLLRGAVRKLRGDRDGAIRLFLEAAELDGEAIAAIAEMKAEDKALQRLRQHLKAESEAKEDECSGNSGETAESPQEDGQQADGDAADAQ